MYECQQQFKKEISLEMWECLTGYRKEEQGEASVLNQLHPSNIVLPRLTWNHNQQLHLLALQVKSNKSG